MSAADADGQDSVTIVPGSNVTPETGKVDPGSDTVSNDLPVTTTANGTTVASNGDKEKKPVKAEKPPPVSMGDMFRFADAFDVTLIIVGMISGLANGSAQVINFYIMGDLLNALNSQGVGTAIAEKALLFVWVGLGAFVVASLQVLCFTVASERMTIRLREAYLRSVLAQDIAFFDVRNSGELAASVAENSLVFREALGDKFGSLFQFVGLFISGFVMGFVKEWSLALVILAVAPLLAICGALMMKIMGDITTGQLTLYAKSGAVAEETISQVRTVAGLTIEENRIAMYTKNLDEAEVEGVRKARWQGVAIGLTLFVMFSAYGIGFWYGSVVVSRDQVRATKEYPPYPVYPPELSFCALNSPIPQLCAQSNVSGLTFETEEDICNCPFCMCGCWAPEMTIQPGELFTASGWSCAKGGDVIITFFAILVGAMSIGQAAPAMTAFNNGRAAAASIYAVIDRKPAIHDSSFDDDNDNKGGSFIGRGRRRKGSVGRKKKITLESIKGKIDLQDVHFTYVARPDAPIFTGLNLSIPAGKTVALVGESGSGKSTIISLIERFYDPSRGKVLLDDVDITEIDAHWYRNLLGYVGQEPTLFATSIRQNILWGTERSNVTQEEVEKAARSANAHDFIMSFPQKYDTLVGGNGSQLSGGQKQRIAIARALIRNPSILLLDEATSALDNQSERVVQEAIDAMIAQSSRTTIVVAHRLSTVRNADLIVVLGKGRVLEQGTHKELMANQATYAALVALAEKGGHGEKDKAAAENDAAVAEKITVELDAKDAAMQPEEGDAVKVEIREEPNSQVSPQSFTNLAHDGDTGSLNGGEKKEDNKEAEAPKAPAVPVSRAFIFVKDDKWMFVPGLFFAALNGATFPIFSVIFSRMTEVYFFVISSEITVLASYWALGFFGLALATGLSNFGQIAVFGYIENRMTSRVRKATFRSVLRSEVGYFDMPENSVGRIVSTLASDAALVKAVIADRIAVVAMNLVTIIAGFTIAFVASWKVTLVVLAMFPVLALSAALQVTVMTGMAINDQSALAASGGVLSESIIGIRTVTALGLKSRVVELYSEFLSGPMRAAVRKGITSGLAFGFSMAIPNLANALAFWYGGMLITDGELKFQELMQAFFGVMLCSVALGQTSQMNADIAKGGPAVNSVFAIVDRESKIDPLSEAGEKPSTVLGDISFRDVGFSYPARPLQKVFDGFNLEIKRGEVVALVGTSGSGKSTIVQLVQRFYDPDQGSVHLDGVNLRDLNVRWLRSHYGIVSQEPSLFVGTIRDNIKSCKPDATEEEVLEALRLANAYDFVMKFPDQLDTMCGPKGAQLSGGQKQRICIARALVKNPAILLLDEATSALDGESERIVQEALDDLMKKQRRTTIIVAHRLSTIKNADKIFVLDKGKVVETGTYDSLLAAGGAFARLYSAQKKQGV